RFLFWLAFSLQMRHEYPDARRLGEMCLEIAEETGDSWLIGATCTVVLGEVAYVLDDFAAAKQLIQRGLRVFGELRMPWGIGRAYRDLGRVALAVHDYSGAEDNYRQSIIIYREAGQTWETLHSLAGIANLQVALNRKEQAVELLTLIVQHPVT